MNSSANQPPTFTESDSAHAIAPSATMTIAAMPSCKSARPPARKPLADRARSLLNQPAQHQDRPHGAHIEQRRKAEQQSREQARAQACGDGAPWKMHDRVHRQAAFRRRQGSASITAAPPATPINAPSESKRQCLQRERCAAGRRSARQRLSRIASMSMRCSRCACIAIATPIAPSTMATRQIRLRIAVALSRPWLSAGFPSLKVHHLRVGQNRFNLLAHSRIDPLLPAVSAASVAQRGSPAPAVPCSPEMRATPSRAVPCPRRLRCGRAPARGPPQF